MSNLLKVSLTALIVFSLLFTACSSKKGDVKEENKPAETKQPVSAVNNDEKYGFPLKETIQLNILATKPNNNKVANFNDYELFKRLEKETNVHINWSVSESTTRHEKLNLMIASGDYPDALYGIFPSKSNLSTWAKQGILIPLNELIDQYAPNIKKLFADHPEYKAASTHADGIIYSLPKAVDAPFYLAPDTMYINKKWLDQVGLAVPTTTEELYDALKAFKGKDLNGNGKQDEIPMSFMYNSNYLGGNSLAGSFGIMDHQEHHTYIKDGKLMYAPQEEGYREYVTYMNKLYSEGLLDKEMFTQTEQVYTARLQNEVPVLGVVSYPIVSFLTNGDEEYVPLVGLKGPHGDTGWKQENPGIWGGAFAITSANKNPEITMKWIDSHYAYEMSLEIQEGPVGLGLKKLDNGKYESIAPPEGIDNVDFRFSLAPGFYAPNIIPSENYTEGGFITPREVQEMAAFSIKAPFLKYKPLNTLLVYDAEDYIALEKYTDLNGKNAYINTSFTDFVVNGLTDEKWSKYLDQLKNLGVDEYLKIHSKYQFQ